FGIERHVGDRDEARRRLFGLGAIGAEGRRSWRRAFGAGALCLGANGNGLRLDIIELEQRALTWRGALCPGCAKSRLQSRSRSRLSFGATLLHLLISQSQARREMCAPSQVKADALGRRRRNGSRWTS